MDDGQCGILGITVYDLGYAHTCPALSLSADRLCWQAGLSADWDNVDEHG